MYLTEAQAKAQVGDLGREGAELLILLGNALLTFKDRHDVFLSHSLRDAELVLGVKRILEKAGKSVYVDWIEDPALDRSSVSAATAQTLRERMRKSDTCLYLHSRHSGSSRWMPWELGYFDGMNGNVAVLPLIPPTGDLDFSGQEYLELYPKIDFTDLETRPNIYVNRSLRTEAPTSFRRFEDWRTNADKLRPGV